MRLRRRRAFVIDHADHAARLHASDMWLREARVFAEEMATWPTPLASWLALLAEGEPTTVQGSDIVAGPDPRWHFVKDQRVFGGGPYGRPGRRGAPDNRPPPFRTEADSNWPGEANAAGTGNPIHDEALRRARGF